MLNLYKRYRADYTGEEIVIERRLAGQVWSDLTDFMPNTVTNNQISNRAVVIGNGPSRLKFDLRNLQHHSGLLGEYTVQTYGCNALYRDFTPDFLIAGNSLIANEIAGTDYCNNNIVYARAIDLKNYPGKFHLIPFDPYTDAGTTAAYIAAFDGHKKIYMLGFDGQPDVGFNYNIYANTTGYDSSYTKVLDYKWINDKKTLFDLYDDVDFVFVSERGTETLPEQLKYCSNLRQLDFRNFVLETDL